MQASSYCTDVHFYFHIFPTIRRFFTASPKSIIAEAGLWWRFQFQFWESLNNHRNFIFGVRFWTYPISL